MMATADRTPVRDLAITQALAAQVERLTAERDEARAEAARWHHDLILLRAELEAERGRARTEGRRVGWQLP